MTKQEKLKPNICMTASGYLVHNKKILLIKHKKLQVWLPPGGHIEQGELPHQAAEREFWEETGLKVKASGYINTDFMPIPFKAGLHWVSKENYQRRENKKVPLDIWKRGCEQHYDQGFIVEAIDGLNYKKNIEETDGIAWFKVAEIEKIDTFEDIKEFVKKAFLVNK